jgi:hypothetical protein
MLRTLGSAVLVTLLVVSLAVAQVRKDDPKAGTPTKATITKVDAAKNTLTVKFKDQAGKEQEKTFELKGDVKMFDETGKVITIDAYRVGNQVLLIEREGRLMELRKDKAGGLDRPGDKKPGDR